MPSLLKATFPIIAAEAPTLSAPIIPQVSALLSSACSRLQKQCLPSFWKVCFKALSGLLYMPWVFFPQSVCIQPMGPNLLFLRMPTSTCSLPSNQDHLIKSFLPSSLSCGTLNFPPFLFSFFLCVAFKYLKYLSNVYCYLLLKCLE